jgi:serine protease AprX
VTTSDKTWADRTLVALHGLPVEPDADGLAEEVALGFADRFDPTDRNYAGLAARPQWQGRVTTAVAALRTAGLVEPGSLRTTTAGARAVPAARRRLTATARSTPPAPHGTAAPHAPAASPARRHAPAEEQAGGRTPGRHRGLPVLAGVIAAPLRDADARRGMGFTGEESEPVPVMVELNLQFAAGPRDALARLARLWERATTAQPPELIAGRYLAGELTMSQMKRLVSADAVPVALSRRSIHHIWPDFPVRPHIDASCVTIKADAARNSFEADGRGIVWAVVDSGIDETHQHFSANATLSHESVRELHRYFPLGDKPTADGALEDTTGHGTHVAGIIAGAIGPWLAADEKHKLYVTENRYNAADPGVPLRMPREADPAQLAGMAPKARLVSLRALDGGGTLNDRVNRVIQALAYVREVNGDSPESMRIHGVNLSLGYEFDPEWFACGRSPLCQEIDRLVRTGVVVVVAAGNSGYGRVNVTAADAPDNFGLSMTVNDPGNAELAITVGSTHRSAPHFYGVSYFSSKGPTGDGRDKPDLVAPGERITSCAAGANLIAVAGSAQRPDDTAVYVEDTGTSMAAPHVSGAVAALLSVRREFIGQPDRVKRILLDSATDLGRRRDFQGAGLVDLMRALQQKI